ncbi:MAG: alginate export family protein [Bacteroidetes bacterium]|nr:alginate export family protein [Bacteroidota bacterium]
MSKHRTQRWILLLVMAVSTLSSQNFSKVIEIVGGMEETMKGMIAQEEQMRKSEIAALRTDLNSLKSVILRGAADGTEQAAPAAGSELSIVERLEALESRFASREAAGGMSQLTGQLDQLLGELKNVINEGKKQQDRPAPVPSIYSFSGQVRHRGELDGRTFAPEARTLGYNLLRTRLNLQIVPLTDVKLFVQVQDSRLFGAGNPALNRGVQDGMSKNIEFHQAYFSVQNLYDMPVSVRIGRQEMAYGKQRLIATSGWNNVGNTFDAGSVQWKQGSFSLDLFMAELVGAQTTTSGEHLGGAYAFYRFDVPLTADLFLFMDNNTTPLTKGPDKGKSRLDRTSLGTTVNGKSAPFDYEVELILQRGSLAVTDSSAVADIDANLFCVGGGMLLDAESKLRLGVKFQRMSGDADQMSGTYTAYNTLFSSAHSFFGYMDFFPKTLPQYGVQALSLHASADIAEKVSMTGDAYLYRFDAEPTIKTASGAVVKDRSLGYEADVTVTHRYNASITVNGGVSAFVPEPAMRAVKGPAVSYWTYLMTVVSF